MNASQPVIKKVSGVGDGSELLDQAITATPGEVHLVEDGEWIIEASYVDGDMSAYRVINDLTKEIIGEYAVSEEPITNAIPGVSLVVKPFGLNKDENNDQIINVGDYVKILTTAGKTEKEAEVKFGETVEEENALRKALKLGVNLGEDVQDITYTLSITSKEEGIAKFTVVEKEASSELPIYARSVGSTYTVTFGEKYIDIIPGIEFSFDEAAFEQVMPNDQVDIVCSPAKLGSAPAEKSTYYVSYKYRKAEEDYMPKIFFDYDDIVEEYGNYDVTASGVVVNSLALGAEIAFTNGVGSIVCVQAKNDSDYEMNKAIDALQRSIPGVTNINTIVPLTKSPEVGAHAMKHVEITSAYENGKERMVYLGAYPKQKLTKKATTADRTLGMIETAKGYANERVVYVVPGELTKEIRDLRSGRIVERTVPACYAAVAVAALGLVNDPAEPLTNKSISGFKQLGTLYMESEKNLLAESGCLVLDQRGSSIYVRHGITTSTEDVNSTEITLIQIKDYVIEAVRSTTGELYIGNKNKPSIISDVTYTLSSILGQFVSQEIILGFSNLSVKRSKEDPRQIDVKFEIEAVYPLNYINISFGFSAVS